MSKALPKGTVLGSPFCSACGHDLSGAVTSSACPECGRPLVEVLERRTANRFNRKPTRRYQSSARVLGMPLVSIATGPDEQGRLGHAKGFFALGDIATGVFALGGLSRGVVAFGGMSFGCCGFGGMAMGLFSSFGGLSIAACGSAVGGCAVGLLASGGVAIGGLAQGGAAIGWLSRGGRAIGPHAWQRGATPSAELQSLFDQFSLFIGPAGPMPQILYGVIWSAAISIGFATLALLLLLAGRKQGDSIEAELRRGPGRAFEEDRAR